MVFTNFSRSFQWLVLLDSAILLFIGAGWVQANTFVLPPTDIDVVGQIFTIKAGYEETLPDIAREFDIGHEEIRISNPKVDMWLPGQGTKVQVPLRFILPDAPKHGLVLNVPEMRLYYFPERKREGKPILVTYPVSIGRMDWSTPLGKTRIIKKKRDPSWRPPQSILREAELEGRVLATVVPPGPDNPLGRYAMRLGIPGYLIHGTNRPFGVGMRVTHGCIRMYPEDIEVLFEEVKVGTKVHIVNQPYKTGWIGNTLYFEAHAPLEEDQNSEKNGTKTSAMTVVSEAIHGQVVNVDWDLVSQLTNKPNGMPVAVGSRSDRD